VDWSIEDTTGRMKIHPTKLDGVALIELRPFSDERGTFTRIMCRRELAALGLVGDFVQCNRSVCKARGTLRGLHYQTPPHAEAKLVHCIAGRIFDVAVDVRMGSPTFLDWIGVELDASGSQSLYVGPGFAHGYLALTDGAEVVYHSSAYYQPEHEGRVRFDDPRVGIDWPIEDPTLSPKDSLTPLLLSDFEGIVL
jgi:dTDP-4-dehydrorhamnose 3,5-epimerase